MFQRKVDTLKFHLYIFIKKVSWMGDPFWQYLVDIESSYKRLRGQSHPQFKGDLGGIYTLVWFQWRPLEFNVISFTRICTMFWVLHVGCWGFLTKDFHRVILNLFMVFVDINTLYQYLFWRSHMYIYISSVSVWMSVYNVLIP